MPTTSLDHRASYGESICPYCGVGCRLWAEVGYGQVLRIKGVADAEANQGRICAKGATLDQTIVSHDRATMPLMRRKQNGPLERTTWNRAIDELAGRFRQIIGQHGPDAVAFYGSGQLDSQAVYCASKLFKGHLGTNNTDSNSRLCMAAAVGAYRSSLGSDGPPTCYDDIEQAEVIFIVGSNMAEAHPVTFDRIKAERKRRPELKIIVVDPRRTTTADHADFYVSVKPGGDIALLNALGLLLLENDSADEKFIQRSTNGFADYRDALGRLDLGELSQDCGIGEADLIRLADFLGGGRRLLSFYCMGLGQSTVGMWKINSLINLHLLTGTIGRAGCGPFSLTGQPNAMGGREIGLLSHQLPGYRMVDDPQHRAEVETHWNLPPGSISDKPGLTAVEMFRVLERGRVKAIWIAGTNPLVSMPDLHQARRAMQQAELVVVQDAYHPTETGELADVVLPAAAWGEKEWTSTNSERTVAHSQQLVQPPGEALPDWEIFCRFARRLGLSGFDFRNAGEVWNEWIGLSADRLCDMSGMTHDRLRQQRHLQWPCTDESDSGTKRLYTEGRFAHDDGRAVFHYRPHREPKEPTDHEFPLVMTSGRLYAHWHTLTRTAKSKQLMRRDGEPYLEIHPDTAAALRLSEGELAQLSSRRGTIQLKTRISDRVPPELVFVPIHWGDLFVPGDAVNYLTISAIGRVAKQPELKYCAVAVEKITDRQDGSFDEGNRVVVQIGLVESNLG